MAPVDHAAWARARETVHIYGGTWDGARVVWTQLQTLRLAQPNQMCLQNYRHIKRKI
jgi:hypothetical protein